MEQNETVYDSIIIGSGPAGLTAAIYALRAKRNILMLEKTGVGGQVAQTLGIENYPGFEKIDGYELSQKMYNQAKAFGLVSKFEDAIEFDLKSNPKIVKTHKNIYKAKSVIICTGAVVKELNADGEKRLFGRGVSYCATCDGNFYRGKNVAIVGGGNTSLDDALYLSNIVEKVYLIHRRDEFRGNEITVDRLKKANESNPGRVEFVLSSEVKKINGEDRVESIDVLDKKTNKISNLKIDGIFIAVGRRPDTEIFSGVLDLDEGGYIKTNEKMESSIKNVFACGDVRNTPLRQIVTACADGAVAAMNMEI